MRFKNIISRVPCYGLVRRVYGLLQSVTKEELAAIATRIIDAEGKDIVLVITMNEFSVGRDRWIRSKTPIFNYLKYGHIEAVRDVVLPAGIDKNRKRDYVHIPLSRYQMNYFATFNCLFTEAEYDRFVKRGEQYKNQINLKVSLFHKLIYLMCGSWFFVVKTIGRDEKLEICR